MGWKDQYLPSSAGSSVHPAGPHDPWRNEREGEKEVLAKPHLFKQYRFVLVVPALCLAAFILRLGVNYTKTQHDDLL